MDFRLLGPLEVRNGERQVKIGASRQRAVLVSLLLRRGEVVSLDAIIDDLWGDSPPATARATVRNYIRRLRVLLPGPPGADESVLGTEPPGYVLRTPPDSVDLDRFERLVAAANTPGISARAAVHNLRAALALWRGRALTNIGDVAMLHIEAHRLDEMRVLAVEDCIAAELRLGLHRQVVPQLRQLVARHPMRERLHELLMLAMYRCGWRQEALECYQHTRTVLVDAIGLEPGPSLQRLHHAILTGDPSLERPRDPAAELWVTGSGMALEFGYR